MKTHFCPVERTIIDFEGECNWCDEKENVMTKDEAIHKALKVLNCLNNDRVYETAWVKGAINACEKALEHPSWQELSDDEVNNIYPCAEGVHDFRDIVRAIEQALKEKNHGIS